MGYVKLRDIPIKTLAKYLKSNQLDISGKSLNPRYTPNTEPYTINKFFRYIYTVSEIKITQTTDEDGNSVDIETDEEKTYSIDTVMPMCKNISTELFNKIFKSHISAIKNVEYSKVDDRKQIYYIPFDDEMARYFQHQTCYPYVAIINGEYYYNIEYTYDNDIMFYQNSTLAGQGDSVTVLGATLSGTKHLVQIKTHKKDGTENVIYYIPANESENGLKYYPLYSPTDINVEIGRLYELKPFNLLKSSLSDNKILYNFHDNYLNRDINFTEDNLPLTPLEKYLNYSRKIYKSLFGNSTSDTDDGIKNPKTNLLYLDNNGNLSITCDYIKRISYTNLNGSTTSLSYNTASHTTTQNLTTYKYVLSDKTTYGQLIKYYEEHEERDDVVPIIDHGNSDVVFSPIGFKYDKASIITTDLSDEEIENINKRVYNDSTISRIKYILKNNSIINLGSKYNISNKSHSISITDDQKETLLQYKNNGYDFFKRDDGELLYFEVDGENKQLTVTRIGKYLSDLLANETPNIHYVSTTTNSTTYVDYYVKGGCYNIYSDGAYTNLYNNLADHSWPEIIEYFQQNGYYQNNNSNAKALLTDSEKTIENKSDSVFKTLASEWIINDNIQTYYPGALTDRYTSYKYYKSLFKNTLYCVTSEAVTNAGGNCYNKYTKNSYIGFIDPRNSDIMYTTGNISKSSNRSTSLNSGIELTENEKRNILSAVKNKSLFTRLFNYEEYPINAEEVLTEENKKLYEKQQDCITSNVLRTKPIVYNKTTAKTYGQYISDIQDVINLCLNLYTSYLYCDDSVMSTESDNLRIDDQSVLTTSITASEYYGINNLKFYRANIPEYIEKLTNDANDHLLTAATNYNLRYVFQGTSDDEDVFFELLNNKIIRESKEG